MIRKNPLTGKECLKLLDQASRHVDRAEHYWIEQQNLADAKAEIGSFSGIRTAIQHFGPKGGDFWRVVTELQRRVNALWKRLMHAEHEGYGKSGVRHLPFDMPRENGGKMGPTALANRRGQQADIVKAFLEKRSRRLALAYPMHGTGGRGHRYSTDGKSLYVWGNLVAEHRRGSVYITDAGWLTLLTKNTLNEVMEQLGTPTRIYSKRGKWRIWNYETKQEQDWSGAALVFGGRVRPISGRGRSVVFPGYERRSRWRPPPPPPPPKPKLAGERTLFNPKVRINLHLPVERAQASKLFRRVYGIAYRAIKERRWMLAAQKFGVMWGLWHAAAIERPPLTRLVRSWYGAIKEIERIAKGAGSPDFWTAR